MDAPPQVSVILPVYDGERYLEAALRSVLAQGFRDFELVICDDASRDGSLAKLHAVLGALQDPRVRLLRHDENRGLFPTLNHLVRESRGALVRLWSQDDVMHPHCLEREVRFFELHPKVAMAYCACDWVDERGVVVDRAGRDTTPEELSPAQASELMLYYGPLSPNIANVTLRRSTFDQVGMFREDLKVSGDFEMWTRIAERLSIGCVHESLVLVRRHSGQLSRRSGVVPVFMRENRAIHRTLLSRLPAGAQTEARRYLRRHIDSSSAHHAVRCLLRGELGEARETLAALRMQGPALPAFAWWLATGNGRWLKPRPRLVTF